MGNKLTLNDVANLQNESSVVTTLAQNNRAIETAMENTLSRDGTYPNYMQDNLDMNSKRILNLPDPITDTDVVRLKDIADISNVTISPLPPGGTTGQVVAKNSNTSYDVGWKTLTKVDVGLNNVDNTSDAAKNSAVATLTNKTISGVNNTFQNIPVGTINAQPQYSILGNNTGSTATMASFQIPALTTKTTPGPSDYVLLSDTAAAGAFKKATVSSLNSMQMFNPRNYGALGDGTTDDSTAIQNCITAAVAAGGAVYLDDGTYKHGSTLNWAWNRLPVVAGGSKVKFVHSGTGVGHQFSGIINYPGTQGCIGNSFGLMNKISVSGNANTTHLILIDNWHWGYLNISGRNAATNIIYSQDTGLPAVGSSAVCTTFDIVISPNIDGAAFTTTPYTGVDLNKINACQFKHVTIEGCGTGTRAFRLNQAVGCNFMGGTVESNLAGGVLVDANSVRNFFQNLDVEVNGAQEDWYIAGKYNTFIGCSNGGTTNGTKVLGTNNSFIGCALDTVTNSGNYNYYMGCNITTSFTETSNTATVINCLGGVATNVEDAPTILGNKTINTAGNNTIKINSVDVTSPWVSFSPTLAPISGSFTTAAVTDARYMQWGKLVVAKFTFTVTAANTASGLATITLPVNALSGHIYTGSGIESAVNGKQLLGFISAADNTKVRISYYDATTPWVNGTTNTVTITYEAA